MTCHFISFSATTRPASWRTRSTNGGSPVIWDAEIVVPYRSPFWAASLQSASVSAARMGEDCEATAPVPSAVSPAARIRRRVGTDLDQGDSCRITYPRVLLVSEI